MMAERHDVIAGYLELAGYIGKECIWVSVVRGVSCTSCLALSLAPSKVCLGPDLPPTANVNAVLPTSGDLEAAA